MSRDDRQGASVGNKALAIRLCGDEWKDRLRVDLFDKETRDRLEQLFWDLAQDLVERGRSVIPRAAQRPAEADAGPEDLPPRRGDRGRSRLHPEPPARATTNWEWKRRPKHRLADAFHELALAI